jgi:hypothetical protein
VKGTRSYKLKTDVLHKALFAKGFVEREAGRLLFYIPARRNNIPKSPAGVFV